MLVLYLGGLLKDNTQAHSHIRDQVLYHAVQRNILANNYCNMLDKHLAILPLAKDANKILNNTDLLIDQIEWLNKHDIKSFIDTADKRNKYIDDIAKKFNLLDKLGLLK